jgi:nitroreductase
MQQPITAFRKPVTEIISGRFSCRAYRKAPIVLEEQAALVEFAAGIQRGPLGTPLRFQLLAANSRDSQTLRGLGTYGFISNPAGFLAGGMGPGEKNLEDFGYGMEELILHATDLELGTCWLGGSFTRSTFARRLALRREEHLPAVVSIGYISAAEEGGQAPMRHRIGGDNRLPWEALFFAGAFGKPLSRAAAGAYAVPLEMLRQGPSASNKQPWRVIHADGAWHFYLQRTPGYPGGLAKTILGVSDVQRVDLGIAMCHFEYTARELGLAGRWEVDQPPIETPDPLTKYTVSWVSQVKA